MPSQQMDQKQRILRSVDLHSRGCWNWRLGTDRVGYGRIKVQMGSRAKFRTMSAHRYAWELWRGPIPEGICVLHKCDNRRCCNPDHLFLGTQADNLRDMHSKGRGPRGFRRDPAVCAANARKRAAIDAAMSALFGDDQ